MGHLIYALAFVIKSALTLYLYIVIASAILSWVNPDPYNPIVRFLRSLTEPVFNFLRQRLPFVMVGGIDLSPILVIFAIQFLQIAVVGNLLDLANALRSSQSMMVPPSRPY
jgi:YggT family protein